MPGFSLRALSQCFADLHVCCGILTLGCATLKSCNNIAIMFWVCRYCTSESNMALEFVFKYLVFLGTDNPPMVWQVSVIALHISALHVVEHCLSSSLSHTRTHTHAHTHMHTHVHTCIHAHTHVRTCTHTHFVMTHCKQSEYKTHTQQTFT